MTYTTIFILNHTVILLISCSLGVCISSAIEKVINGNVSVLWPAAHY